MTGRESLFLFGFGTPMAWPLWLALLCFAALGVGWLWSQRNE